MCRIMHDLELNCTVEFRAITKSSVEQNDFRIIVPDCVSVLET